MTIEKRDKRIASLSAKIVHLMREHPNRVEAIAAHDMARILFRRDFPAIPSQRD
jgi:hypothetical protein